MTLPELLQYLRAHPLAVQATVTGDGSPQASVVGIVVTDAFELFFDTLDSTRKFANLRANPRVAFVIGWEKDQTVQFEGLADFPAGAELADLQTRYFATFTDGRVRQSWPGIRYVRVRPNWIRYSDFRTDQPTLAEFTEFEVPA